MRTWLGLALFALLAAAACGRVSSNPTSASDTCSAPTMSCSGSCVDIASDPANCGLCGARCTGADKCVDGACQSTGCPPMDTNCSGECVNLKFSESSCGSCGNACKESQQCWDGACVCPAANSVCDGECTNVATSDAHCGGCNQPCDPYSACSDGVCRQRCAPPLVWCNSRCVDLTTDTAACGSCGTLCQTPGELCVDGKCSCMTGAGFTQCGSDCVDVTSDPRHCGSCGNVCEAFGACEQGVCRRCTDGFFFCPDGMGDPRTTCLAQAGTPSEQCQCNNCLTQLANCQSDRQCVNAWLCAKRANCTTPCWAAFTQCGGGGGRFAPGGYPAETTQRLDELFNCMQANSCGY